MAELHAAAGSGNCRQLLCRCFLRSPCEIQSLLHGPGSNLGRVESVHHAVRSYRAGTGRQSVPTVHQNGTRPRSARPVNGRSITQERKTPRFWATYFHHPEKNEKVKLLLGAALDLRITPCRLVRIRFVGCSRRRPCGEDNRRAQLRARPGGHSRAPNRLEVPPRAMPTSPSSPDRSRPLPTRSVLLASCSSQTNPDT